MIRLMVVEDEPPIMRQIVKLIEEYSDAYEVAATAGNGKKALELLEEVNVEVVFSDIKMPLVDGLELAEQLKVKFPNIIVVIVSGYQDFQFARKAIQFHVYEYLLKPVSKDAMDKLLSAIEAEVEQKRNLKKQENSAENDSKRVSNHSTAEKIELYLKNNYSETITNTLLSKKFGFVPSYISKIFRAYKGMSPSEYLTFYRIDISKKLISEQPDLLLKEVSEMVGFSDQHYFSKTFKKETGMWPTEYRSKK